MSAATTSRDPIDIEAIVARIDRDLAEQAKLRRESEKFIAEQQKLMAEREKLTAEASKLNSDRGLAPWLAIIGLIGGLLAIANFLSQMVGRH